MSHCVSVSLLSHSTADILLCVIILIGTDSCLFYLLNKCVCNLLHHSQLMNSPPSWIFAQDERASEEETGTIYARKLQRSHTLIWDTVSEIPILKWTLWNCYYLHVTLLNIIPNGFVCNKVVFIFLCHWVPDCAESIATPGAGAVHVPREFVPRLYLRLASVLDGGLVSKMMILVMSCDSWIKNWLLTDWSLLRQL